MKALLLPLFLISVAVPSPTLSAEFKCQQHEANYRKLVQVLFTNTKWEVGEVYVNKNWYTLTLQDKQVYAHYLAVCKSKETFVAIYDGYTGKKLALYSPRSGYNNYEN